MIIEKVSFHINEGDRIGIVGKNGAGKSTLLNMLCGELPHDDGEFFVGQNTRIGYLKQRENFRSDRTVIEEVTEIFRPLLDMEAEMEAVAARLSQLAELEATLAAGGSVGSDTAASAVGVGGSAASDATVDAAAIGGNDAGGSAASVKAAGGAQELVAGSAGVDCAGSDCGKRWADCGGDCGGAG